MKRHLAALVLGTFVFVFSGAFQASAAIDAAEFYKKNKITLVVGSNPGGGSDLGGRIIAKFWPTVTGGEMVIKNVSGASGIVGLNYVTNSTKPDGRTMFMQMFCECYLISYLDKTPACKYDSSKLNYIAGCYVEPWALVAGKKYRTLDDLKAASNLKMAGMGKVSAGVFGSLALLEPLNLDAKLITGFKSMGEALLAVGKEEIDFVLAPLTLAMQQANQGVVPPPLFLMLEKRDPAVPDIPVFTEFVQLTPEQKKLFDETQNISRSVRMAAMSEGVPPELVQFVREAFEKIEKLPEFRADVAKVNQTGTGFIMGKDLDVFLQECFALEIKPLLNMINKYSAMN